MNEDSILLVTDGLGVGGMERQIVELLKGLKRNSRFRMVLAVLDRGGAFEADAARLSSQVLPVRRRARFDGTAALFLAWQAWRARARLIHAVGWMSGLAGLFAARCLRVPIINESIQDAPRSLDRRQRVSRWCALRSDMVVTCSPACLAAYGLDRHPDTIIIANGIDMARFEAVVPGGSAAPTICMVASFRRSKDHASLIRALPDIHAACPQARLVLVGNDAGTLASSRRLVADLGLEGAVRFVTDTTSPEPYIAGSQVCVLTSSDGEGLSNAILEYMALAKPVVATACAGNTAVVGDGVNGFLVPDNVPQLLAARVIELLQQPERARQMGEAGRRQVQAFSLPRMVANHEALYSRLLGSAAAPVRGVY